MVLSVGGAVVCLHTRYIQDTETHPHIFRCPHTKIKQTNLTMLLSSPNCHHLATGHQKGYIIYTHGC